MASLACFRAEGVLLRRRASACAAWMALHQREVLGRFGRVGAALASPLAGLLAGAEPHVATVLRWRALAGCSGDRLTLLGEDWWQLQLQDGLNPVGLDLVRRCRDAGHRIVLVSDHPDVAVSPLREFVGADALHCNRLEVSGGRVTGKLLDPIVSGRVDGGWLRQESQLHGLDPATTLAYGSADEDATLLSGAGRPCAVTPDRSLLRLATELHWPVVHA